MKEKIILGLGDNIDYEVVWNSEVFENLITRYSILDDELDVHIGVNSERDLVISILSFLKSGNGGERFVSSSDIIERFAQNFENKITLGGTSVRAAIAMRKLGYTSALHLVTINDHVRRLIPQDSPYVCSNRNDSSYPHLIVQFSKDTRVKAGNIDIRTNRANRIIYDNDYDNIMMNLNDDFSNLITDARVFLISGFNAMQSKELLANRLVNLLRIIEKLPKDALVYYEDACFHHPDFTKLIHSTLADSINIYSLNEDELQIYLGRKLDLLNAFQIKEALVDIQNLIPVPLIVVHSMYWALAYGEKAMSVSKALKGGITMATTRFRFGDDFTVEHYKETKSLPPNEEGVKFAGELKKLLGDKICCAPVVDVEESNATTVGLGDAFVGGFLPALL
ncbi:MAG TPA: ADP-dependent glucokinase/phosphofructokinase [Anaerolineaceae bacterium]|nr:ADP-dependent glucokinase/phosphofructokinase [Anaerolineaceae bacterium]